MTRPGLSDQEYRLWAEWLAEELGMHWGPERRQMLRTRLEPRRAALGLASYEQLLFHLRFHPEREAERERLVPHLTNNESYFCREPAALELIRREVLPALAQGAGAGAPLRLLSAACAAGEEAYTLAALAREAAPGVPVHVTGMDVDGDALERARAGRFGPHAFRAATEEWRQRHFRPAGPGVWEVREELRRGVEFRPGNLVAEGWWKALPPQHLVLCRNVLIYFGDDGIRRAARGLYEATAPGGYLFLGHADSLRTVPVPFRLERRPGALFYRRPAPGEGGP